MKKASSRSNGLLPIPSSSAIPAREDSMRKRGSDGETSIRGAPAETQKKAREDQPASGGEERATRSYTTSSAGRREGAEERNGEEFEADADADAEEEARGGSFSWERLATNQQRDGNGDGEEEREEQHQPEEVPEFDAEAAVKKLTQTKEYFAELCRNYLANYKTQGADVSFWLSSSSSTHCSTDSRDTACPEKERTFEERNGRNPASPEKERTLEERNAAGQTASFTAAACPPRPPPASSNHQPAPACECRRMPSSDADVERRASFSAAPSPPSNNYHPPPDCRRMPSTFDAFLRRTVLQVELGPSNALYREELSALESRALVILDSFHREEQQVEGDREGGHGECDGTILCKGRASKCDSLELSQFQSYQFAFKAAAVAEIVRLKSDVIKSRMEAPELPRDDTLGKVFSGVRTAGEFDKRLKLQNDTSTRELAQLRAEKTAKEESLAEIQRVKRYLESRVPSCTGNNVLLGRKTGAMTRNVTALCEVKSPELDGNLKHQQRQQDGPNEMGSRLKAIGAFHSGVSAEDEARFEGICEASVEHEVVRLVQEKLETVKADMGGFVKTLQSRIAGVAGKINSDEARVRPVRVGLFCLQYLIDKLLAKKTEIEASLVDKSSDDRLGLKLHFRS